MDANPASSAFATLSSEYRARRAYSDLRRAMRQIDDEITRDIVLSAMDRLWMEMSEADQNSFCLAK